MLNDLENSIADLDKLPAAALRDALVSAYCRISFMRGANNASEEVLNQTRNFTDRLRRVADLVHAISDAHSENALTTEQLNDIAAVVWPAPSAVVDPTAVPTSLPPSPEVLLAAELLWNAHWFFRTIEDMGKTSGGRLTLGEFMERNITQWREKFTRWRDITGVEKHETDEIKAIPH